MRHQETIRLWTDHLAELLDSAAGWRAEKAADYPEDDRNQRSADALALAASFVRQLPEADRSLKPFREFSDGMESWYGRECDLWRLYSGDSPEGGQVISRFWFHADS